MLIFGDTHLGCKDKADDFYDGTGIKENKLIDVIDFELEPIVFNDFEDGWENKHKDIKNAYPEVFKALERRKARGWETIFLESNHHGKDFPFPQVKVLIHGEYVIFHGHHLDLFNSRLQFIGRAITKLCGFLERIGLSNIDLIFNTLQRGRFGGNEAYWPKLERQVKKNPEYDGAIIIMAHTHKYSSLPKELKNCHVRNAGCCTGDHWEAIRIL